MAEAMITFEENDFPVELISDRDIRKAVSAGRLRRDTLVKIHEVGQPVLTRRADTVERLRPFLGIEEPQPAPPPAPERRELPEKRSRAAGQPPRPATPPPPSVPVAPVAPASDARAVPDEDTYHSAQDAGYAPPPPMEPQATPFAPWILPAILVGIIALAALASTGGTPSAPNSYSNVPPSTDANALGSDIFNTSATVPADETVGAAQTFYAARDATVRAEPTASGAQLGILRRGDSVFGIRLRPAGSEELWLRVESGTHSGAYIWLANLSEEARPSLLRSFTENWTVASEVGFYAAPDEASRRLDTLSAGLSVNVIGELQNGWWEIARQTGSGVGYLPPWAFDYGEGEGDYSQDNMSAGSNSIAPPAEPRPGGAPSAAPAPPPERSSWCVFKNGEEIRTTEADCRDRGGRYER
jgi:hypothetical protein